MRYEMFKWIFFRNSNIIKIYLALRSETDRICTEIYISVQEECDRDKLEIRLKFSNWKINSEKCDSILKEYKIRVARFTDGQEEKQFWVMNALICIIQIMECAHYPPVLRTMLH